MVANKGVEKLLDALQDMPAVGHFGVPGNLSWDIHFARKLPLPEGGQRVVLVTDRRIGFWEAANQPRSIDYPFTVIELRLNREGQGEGTMSLATRVIYDKDQHDHAGESSEPAGPLDESPTRGGFALRTRQRPSPRSRSANSAA